MISSIDTRPNGLTVDLVVSNVCNYKCNYCLPSCHNGSSGQPDYKKILNFLNYVHTDVNSDEKYLIVTGGEPIVWADLTKFIKELDPSYRVNITTNGSRTMRWWESFIDQCIDKIYEIVISVHWEFVDINHIIELCKRLQKEKIMISVFLLADIKAFDKIKEYKRLLIESGLKINIMIKPVKDYFNNGLTQSYTEEEKEFIKTDYKNSKPPGPHPGHLDNIIVDGEDKPFSYTRELVSKKLNSFKGWNCQIGTHKITINYDGNVYGAQCNTARSYCYGNIYKDTVKFKPQVIICENQWCGCATDITLPKWR